MNKDNLIALKVKELHELAHEYGYKSAIIFLSDSEDDKNIRISAINGSGIEVLYMSFLILNEVANNNHVDIERVLSDFIEASILFVEKEKAD